jgi:murein L,D-transpeptidase YcbB/YkuD
VEKWMLAGAACAALNTLCTPATAAATPQLPPLQQSVAPSVDEAVSQFYASRQGAPLWLRPGDSNAARELIGVLQRASLDGMPSGPTLAAEAQSLMSRAEAGDPEALTKADRLLSTAWVVYVQALQRPPAGMAYADGWVAPRQDVPYDILARSVAAQSLGGYVRTVSSVNPLYSQLRDAAWEQMQSTGTQPDARVLASLDSVRDMPFQKRYIMVDTASARLYMIENGRIADTMKVIVGKPDASTQTPMLASTIYYATLNPYWHVPDELIRTLIARNVLNQGLGYLSAKGYQVQPAAGESDELLDPAKVDWHAVANGSLKVRVRQLPGPANSMGHLKFGFANASDIFLHDTPVKELFAQDTRSLSHGCIRLEDAERLGRWLLGREPEAASRDPEQNVALPTPVPIYVTYVTAHVQGGQLTYVNDIYGRNAQRLSEVATLR